MKKNKKNKFYITLVFVTKFAEKNKIKSLDCDALDLDLSTSLSRNQTYSRGFNFYSKHRHFVWLS